MIPLPLAPKLVSQEGNKAIFEIEGLYPGYAVTVGNCLRRVLLSSLDGAAITQIKIKDVLHEFSTIPSVMEDVVLIMLNLKKLRFKLYSTEPQTITLSVKGEKEARGKDFKLTSELELVNPDCHIATLTKSSADLHIEAQVERGVGYEPIERREIRKAEVGVLPLDAIFTPVKRVSLSVENMRVGKRTDFGLLRMEIETDGTIQPEEALRRSGEILVKHFALIAGSVSDTNSEENKAGDQVDSGVEDAARVEDDNRKVKVEDLKVSERTKNALIKNSLKTVGGIIKKTESDLSNLEGMGEKAVSEVKKAIKKLGLELKS